MCMLTLLNYKLDSEYDEFSATELKDALRSVCLSMQHGLGTMAIQAGGSDCLYKLSMGERSTKLKFKEIESIIECCLEASKLSPVTNLLQNNVWLVMHNDHMLHLNGINYYRICKRALDTLLVNTDARVERLCIENVSIMVTSMKTEEVKLLMQDAKYVNRLVQILTNHIEIYHRTPLNENVEDNDDALSTIKITLSCLWNLTDECQNTCNFFLNAGGAELAMQLLVEFDTEIDVQIKVLGMLNNIAEVRELQMEELCRSVNIEVLLKCLDGDLTKVTRRRYCNAERSYFAAGTLANLLTNVANQWDCKQQQKEVCEKLLDTIENFPKLPSAMVSYKSLEPFSHIAHTSKSNGAVMWCLWAVHHVMQHRLNENCTFTDDERSYIKMYSNSGLSLAVEEFARGNCNQLENMDPRVVQIADQIVSLVVTETLTENLSSGL